jgi:hypothetical protein
MTPDPTGPSPGRLFVRLALLSAGVALATALLGWWPAAQLGAEVRAGWAWVLGVGLALVAALAGLAPVALTSAAPARARLNGVLGGMLVRMVVLLGLLLPALLLQIMPRVPLAIGAAIGYIFLLAADTVAVVRLQNTSNRSSV